MVDQDGGLSIVDMFFFFEMIESLVLIVFCCFVEWLCIYVGVYQCGFEDEYCGFRGVLKVGLEFDFYVVVGLW